MITVFVCLDAHCTWAINQEQREILPSSLSRPKRWMVTSRGDQRYYTWPRKLSNHIGGLENMFLASFCAKISKILHDLPGKLPRITIQTGYDRYKRLVFVMSLGLLAPDVEFTHYRPPWKWYCKTSEWHQHGKCTTIWACLSIRTNTVCPYRYGTMCATGW